MKYFVLPIILISVLFSCKQDRLISSYVVRNKIVEHHEALGDTVVFPQVKHWYDKKNKSYFEIAKYNYKGVKGLLFSTDLSNKPTGDKYEKVNYSIIDSMRLEKMISYYRDIAKPTKTNKSGTIIDYKVNDEVFITYLIENTPLSQGVKLPKVKTMTLWMNGRRHDLNPQRFFILLEKIR